MKSKYILISIFILSLTLLYSQTTQYIDVINLKNGDLLKGKIVENIINDYIKVEMQGGSTITVKYIDISSISVEKTVQQFQTIQPMQTTMNDNTTVDRARDHFNDGYRAGKMIDTSTEYTGGCILGGLLGIIGWGIAYVTAGNNIPEPPQSHTEHLDVNSRNEYRRGWEKGAREAKINAASGGGCVGAIIGGILVYAYLGE